MCSIAGLLLFTCPSDASAQTPQPPETGGVNKSIFLRGRVLAWQEILASGAGLGPKWTVFIFGAESGGAQIHPLKIAYGFFKSDGPLPDGFFEHSKRYELQTVRDPECDETFDSLAYLKNVDESLPATYVLRYVDGAPRIHLKPDAVLPCYILRPGKYKVLSQDKDGKAGEHGSRRDVP